MYFVTLFMKALNDFFFHLGGPGASSLFGLFTENGPFEVTKSGKVKARKYSWNVNHNVIYIDNPVGTGFSFTDKDEGYAKNQIDVGENLYSALVQFFTLFPDLQPNDFYATGESYAGKYVSSPESLPLFAIIFVDR